jgi:hypothetical protein
VTPRVNAEAASGKRQQVEIIGDLPPG